MKKLAIVAALALSLAGCSLLKEAAKSCTVTTSLVDGRASVAVSCDIPGHVHDPATGNVK